MLSRVQLFETPWTRACQAPLSMGFPQQEYWSGLPFHSPGDLSDLGIKPMSPALEGGFFTAEPPGKPQLLLGRKYFLFHNLQGAISTHKVRKSYFFFFLHHESSAGLQNVKPSMCSLQLFPRVRQKLLIDSADKDSSKFSAIALSSRDWSLRDGKAVRLTCSSKCYMFSQHRTSAFSRDTKEASWVR